MAAWMMSWEAQEIIVASTWADIAARKHLYEQTQKEFLGTTLAAWMVYQVAYMKLIEWHLARDCGMHVYGERMISQEQHWQHK